MSGRDARLRISVVGSGVSGLVTAYLLALRHDVSPFEASGRVGGHTHTVPPEAGGRVHPVDTGFIVFNGPDYPRFNRLLRHVGVGWRETSMSFGVRCDPAGLEYGTGDLPALLARRGEESR